MGINDLNKITKERIQENDYISIYSCRTKMTYKITVKDLAEFFAMKCANKPAETKVVKEVKETKPITIPAKKTKAKDKE